jgi:hypothetical protein
MTRLQSSLARHQPHNPLSDDELRSKARDAWRTRGVLVIWVDELRSEMDRELVHALGTTYYGRRTTR